MIGVILAGGSGTRLRPLTKVVNKHLLPVYNKPMIYYPIQTLKDMGCTDIIIVTGGEHIGAFAELLRDGAEFGVHLTYRVQPEAGGVAQALSCVKGLVTGTFPVILGDNYFETAPEYTGTPCMYYSEVQNPERFGVYDGTTITEKPHKPSGNKAITGLYVYDDSVFGYIAELKPSDRGELEIADVNNKYLTAGAPVIEYKDFWSDMGTFDSLLNTAEHIRAWSGKA